VRHEQDTRRGAPSSSRCTAPEAFSLLALALDSHGFTPPGGSSMRTELIVAGGLALSLLSLPACSSSPAERRPSCTNGRRDGDESGVDCGGSCATRCNGDQGQQRQAESANGIKDGTETDVDCGGQNAPKCTDGKTCATNTDCLTDYCPEQTKACQPPRSDDAVKNGTESDVDCGGASAPKCGEGKSCLADTDCIGACSYKEKCVDMPSCKPHLGGDTCGKGEVHEADAVHESCCRTLPVAGYVDPGHPGKTVYLDKYEITSGRVRAFIADVTAASGGKPNLKDWILAHTPAIWDAAWSKFLPEDYATGTIVVSRLLLGDRRGYADSPPIPETDQTLNTGLDFQFNGQLFVYLHGNNCSTHAPDAQGFPTFFYPADVLAKTNPPQEFPPRADGKTVTGTPIPASEHLEVKSMNCISNALLAAFCHWDGGQLATNEVLDFVTASPPHLGDLAGCGTQIGTEKPPESPAAMFGGRCADLPQINATFDAGGQLPVPGHPRNNVNYEFPYFAEDVHHDKAWQVAAPGRGTFAAKGEPVDMVRINPADEPWMDLHGNLSEAVLAMKDGTFTGRFGLKYRGVGYQSARSDQNMDRFDDEGGLRRIERPEARSALAGGRCMRFK
jgi:hypothetical protein